jgi:hypothetical protein
MLTYAFYCYYARDIEDGIDTIKAFEFLGGGDFLLYNLFLLWLLPPLSSIKIQLNSISITIGDQKSS